jgi:hypothetical protein
MVVRYQTRVILKIRKVSELGGLDFEPHQRSYPKNCSRILASLLIQRSTHSEARTQEGGMLEQG